MQHHVRSSSLSSAQRVAAYLMSSGSRVVSRQCSVVSTPGASCYCYRVNCYYRVAAYALCAASNAASYSGLVMRRSWYLFTYPMCSSRPTRRTCGRSGCMHAEQARRVAGCAAQRSGWTA